MENNLVLGDITVYLLWKLGKEKLIKHAIVVWIQPINNNNLAQIWFLCSCPHKAYDKELNFKELLVKKDFSNNK